MTQTSLHYTKRNITTPQGQASVVSRVRGQVTYRFEHVKCRQKLGFDDVLLPILQQENFGRVIEIGTAQGGFAYFLSDALPNAHIWSFDVLSRRKCENEFLDELPNVVCKVRNIFDEQYLKVIDPFAINLITSCVNEKVLVACDGGNKINEVRAIAPMLKIGDCIMFHDYKNDEITSQALIDEGLWDHFEITREDIIDVLKDNGFEIVYPQSYMVAWGIAKKVRF